MWHIYSTTGLFYQKFNFEKTEKGFGGVGGGGFSRMKIALSVLYHNQISMWTFIEFWSGVGGGVGETATKDIPGGNLNIDDLWNS